MDPKHWQQRHLHRNKRKGQDHDACKSASPHLLHYIWQLKQLGNLKEIRADTGTYINLRVIP
jgi:hypothetical protein